MNPTQAPEPLTGRQIVANIRAAENRLFALPDDGRFVHDRVVSVCGDDGRVTAANASLFTEAFFSEPLTQYAVGFRDPNNIEETVNFFAPPVEVARRFEYAAATNIEEFFSDASIDDLRAIKGDFKEVEYTEAKVNAATLNRGLKITIDLDQVAGKANWRENAVGKLTRRLLRNKLRRGVALLSAAATNTAKTWDVTAGKDPDQDVLTDLITGNDGSGIYPRRVGYGHTAWSKRVLSHRAQNTAGGFASAGMTAEQVAAFLNVDRVLISKERYQSTAAAKAQVVSNLVLMFDAQDNMDTEDSSNIKAFWTPCENGERMRVYEQQITAKLYVLVVEHYELQKITSTLGIRKFTVS
jgi:hypothetical protein